VPCLRPLSRFIINLPKEEQTTDRLFFHIQAAHWFYSDFYVNNPEIVNAGCKVPPCNFKAFSRVIFKHCPFLKSYFEYFEVFFQRFSKYMSQIPVFGAIILNVALDKVLLVTNYRNTFYSFPKGKINQNESGVECAIREVWEEIGLNISKLISEKDFIEFKMGDNKAQKMYVVCGVDENTVMKTNTRCEIGRIEWVPLNEIEEGKNSNIFGKITPFVRPLKLWIRDFASAKIKEQAAVAPTKLVATVAPVPKEKEQQKDKEKEVLSKAMLEFTAKLEALNKNFEQNLNQFDQAEGEDKPNPFLSFKLDYQSLMGAFISSN